MLVKGVQNFYKITEKFLNFCLDFNIFSSNIILLQNKILLKICHNYKQRIKAKKYDYKFFCLMHEVTTLLRYYVKNIGSKQ